MWCDLQVTQHKLNPSSEVLQQGHGAKPVEKIEL